MQKLLLSLCASLLSVSTSMASNLQLEQRIAEQITKHISPGKAHWLGAQDTQFLALHMPASTKPTLGGIILLHDAGANPDAAHVIHDLRVDLAGLGWETLSIQLPLASREDTDNAYHALIPEAAPRIQAAINFFTARQNRNLILIGHGLGARMALAFLDATPAKELRALVAIGLAADPSGDSDPVLEAMSKIKIPMLDLYGSRDHKAVTGSAKLRRTAGQGSGQTGYRQDRVTGADHLFQGLESTLQVRVGAWLRKVATGKEINRGTPTNQQSSVP